MDDDTLRLVKTAVKVVIINHYNIFRDYLGNLKQCKKVGKCKEKAADCLIY